MSAESYQQLHELYIRLGDALAARGRNPEAADSYALALYYAKQNGEMERASACRQYLAQLQPNHPAGREGTAPLLFAQLMMKYPADQAESTLTELTQQMRVQPPPAQPRAPAPQAAAPRPTQAPLGPKTPPIGTVSIMTGTSEEEIEAYRWLLQQTSNATSGVIHERKSVPPVSSRAPAQQPAPQPIAQTPHYSSEADLGDLMFGDLGESNAYSEPEPYQPNARWMNPGATIPQTPVNPPSRVDPVRPAPPSPTVARAAEPGPVMQQPAPAVDQQPIAQPKQTLQPRVAAPQTPVVQGAVVPQTHPSARVNLNVAANARAAANPQPTAQTKVVTQGRPIAAPLAPKAAVPVTPTLVETTQDHTPAAPVNQPPAAPMKREVAPRTRAQMEPKPPAPTAGDVEQHHVYDLGATSNRPYGQSLRAAEDFLLKSTTFPDNEPFAVPTSGGSNRVLQAFGTLTAMACTFAIAFFGYELYPHFSKQKVRDFVQVMLDGKLNRSEATPADAANPAFVATVTPDKGTEAEIAKLPAVPASTSNESVSMKPKADSLPQNEIGLGDRRESNLGRR